jgi:5-methylcytosine-specific restriction endonuclease McrA
MTQRGASCGMLTSRRKSGVLVGGWTGRTSVTNGPRTLRGVMATQVDHVKAHHGNEALRLDPANLQSLCQSCHSRKTATVDHGGGNNE